MGILSVEELTKLTRSAKQSNGLELSDTGSDDLQQLWNRLLETAHHGPMPERHMTAVCNAICFVLRSHLNTPNTEHRKFVLSATTWTQAFDAARTAFVAGKTKPAMQVLETLDYLAHQQGGDALVGSAVNAAVANMLEIIFSQSPKKSLKTSCNVLYFLIRKLSDLISFEDVLIRVYAQDSAIFFHHCHVSNIDWRSVSSYGNVPWYALLLALLMVMRLAESKSATLKLMTLLCDGVPASDGLDMVSIMDECVRVYAACDNKAIEDISRDVLPAILTTADKFHAFLQRHLAAENPTESNVVALLALMSFGKKKVFVDEPSKDSPCHSWAIANKVRYSGTSEFRISQVC